MLQAVEKKADGQSLRFCRECGAFKPDRCHHCAELGQCVLARAHWSPLCNNAIGYYNLKPYLLWLLYASLAHALALAALAPGLLRAADPLLAARGAPVVALRDGGEGSVLAYALVSALTSALVGGAIFFWLVCHAVLAARGVTARRDRPQCGCSPAQRPKPPLPANPFDFGVRANFVKVRSLRGPPPAPPPARRARASPSDLRQAPDPVAAADQPGDRGQRHLLRAQRREPGRAGRKAMVVKVADVRQGPEAASLQVENSSNELYTLLPLSVWRKSESRRSDTSVMSGIDARRDLWSPHTSSCVW